MSDIAQPTHIILLCVLPRGSKSTNSPSATVRIMDLLESVMRFKCSEPLSIDMDAISIVIKTKDMTDEKRQSMRDFLFLFGTDLTLRCGLPYSVPGSTKVDGVFGCKNNKCQHLPSKLNGVEILAFDTPVKVAIHQSCQTQLHANLWKKGVHLTQSRSGYVCFKPGSAANKPPHVKIVDALLDSCYVPKSKLHMFHVADIGFKLPIRPREDDCPLKKLLNGVANMREAKITVEILQLDFGITIPVQSKQLIQFSCSERPSDDSRQSLLHGSGSTKMIYPIHKLPPPGKRKLPSSDTRINGTISLKKRKWGTKEDEKEITIGDQMETQAANDRRETAWNEVRKIYAHNDGSNDEATQSLSTDSSILHSVKLYSSTAHPILQNRQCLPLGTKSMYKAPFETFSKLQRLLDNLKSILSVTISNVTQYGVCERHEYSFRPTLHSKMRKEGHYNDFLTHLFLAANDLWRSGDYSIRTVNILPREVEKEANALVNEAWAFMHFRASKSFSDIYPNPRQWKWLRSHLSLLLITIGFAPEYKIRYLNEWLGDNDRFDPGNRASTLLTPPFPSSSHPREQAALDEAVKKPVRHFLRHEIRVTHVAQKLFVDFLDGSPNRKNDLAYHYIHRHALNWYCQLPFTDKLLMCRDSYQEITALLCEHLSKAPEHDQDESNHFMRQDHFGDDSEVNPHDELRHSIVQFRDGDAPGANTGSRIKAKTNAKRTHPKEVLLSNPVLRATHRITEFTAIFDPLSKNFLHNLCKHILRSHSAKLRLPRRGDPSRGDTVSPLPTELDQQAKNLLSDCCIRHRSLSTRDLIDICVKLEVPIWSKFKNRTSYVQALAKKYLFPCLGCDYDHTSIFSLMLHNEIIALNDLINKTLLDDSPIPIASSNGQKTYYRSSGHTEITIPEEGRVAAEEAPHMDEVFRDSSGYCVLAKALRFETLSGSRNAMESKLRLHIKKVLQNGTPPLKDVFLSHCGKSNPSFANASYIEDLEERQGFHLTITNHSLDSYLKSNIFVPDVMFAIASYACDENIAFYNKQDMKTIIHIKREGRIITYTFNKVDIVPKVDCTIICLHPDNEYSTGRLSHRVQLMVEPPLQHSMTAGHIGGFSIFSGSRKRGKNSSKIIPMSRRQEHSSFALCMHSLLENLRLIPKNNFDAESDSLGIISFIEELRVSQRIHQFTGFDRSTLRHCPSMNHPLLELEQEIKSSGRYLNCHRTLCPIICLKYKLSFGVLENGTDRKRKTYFYGYDLLSEKVVCEVVDGEYCYLEERGAIYFFTSTSSNRTSYYDPGLDRWPIESKLRLKYSHLIGQALENTVMAIKEAHQITMHSPDTNSLSRPHDRTFFMNFSFATFNCESLDEFLMRGLNLPALVLGFPSATEKWNACIVHHPLQNKSDAINLLYTTLHQSVDNNGPPSDDHNDPPQLHAVSGLQPQECELGFYIILYMMIGHKSNSFGQFNHAIQKAQEINDIGFRVRTWVHEIENRVKPKDYIPHWLEIICQQ